MVSAGIASVPRGGPGSGSIPIEVTDRFRHQAAGVVAAAGAHHDQHHAGYVKGANEALEQLDEARFKADFTRWRLWSWAALVWEPVGSRLLTTQIYDHQSNLAQGGIPLLVLDAWEHAYYLQYETSHSMAPRPGSARG